MKKILLLLLIVSYTYSSKAQSYGYKGDEIYTTINSLKDFDFGFAYKLGLSEKLYLRFDVINAKYSSSTSDNTILNFEAGPSLDITKNKNKDFAVGIGIENRVDYNSRLEFLFGISALGGYKTQVAEYFDADLETTTLLNSKNTNYGAGLNLGVIMHLSNNFYLAGELLPKYLISNQKTQYLNFPGHSERDVTTKGQEFDFSLKDIRLSLVYRFRK